jgi:hypothetical protein
LFDNNTLVTQFRGSFQNCYALTAIPSGLFDNCISVTDFRQCFYVCRALTGLAPELWDSTRWSSVQYNDLCFNGCIGLTNYADIPSGWK